MNKKDRMVLAMANWIEDREIDDGIEDLERAEAEEKQRLIDERKNDVGND